MPTTFFRTEALSDRARCRKNRKKERSSAQNVTAHRISSGSQAVSHGPSTTPTDLLERVEKGGPAGGVDQSAAGGLGHPAQFGTVGLTEPDAVRVYGRGTVMVKERGGGQARVVLP